VNRKSECEGEISNIFLDTGPAHTYKTTNHTPKVVAVSMQRPSPAVLL
jgi:hypothetical protein